MNIWKVFRAVPDSQRVPGWIFFKSLLLIIVFLKRLPPASLDNDSRYAWNQCGDVTRRWLYSPISYQELKTTDYNGFVLLMDKDTLFSTVWKPIFNSCLRVLLTPSDLSSWGEVTDIFLEPPEGTGLAATGFLLSLSLVRHDRVLWHTWFIHLKRWAQIRKFLKKEDLFSLWGSYESHVIAT